MKGNGCHITFIDECSGATPAVRKAVKAIMRTMVDGFARGQSVQDIAQLSGYDRATIEAVLRGALKKQKG